MLSAIVRRLSLLSASNLRNDLRNGIGVSASEM